MKLREHYNCYGYAVARELYHPATPKAWAAAIGNRSYLKSLFDEDVDKYVSYLSAMARQAGLQSVILLKPDFYTFLGIETPLIVGPPVIHVMSPDLKIPGGYYGTAAHQDWASVQGSLGMVTLWMPLTDAGIGNFPLEVIPGSHKQGLREGKMNGSVLEIECDEREFVPVECKAGDVVFISGFTVHRTGAGEGFRISVSQRFDNADEPGFVERGYPCAQRRVVDREIPWKPSVEQVRGIFE